jgi:acetyltransferase-like isoleucine patch superfamily enzyme
MWKRKDHIKYAVGKGVKVGRNCKFVDNPIWGTEPYLISIGNHVLISGQVAFINHDGSTWLFRESEAYKDTFKFGPITVGDNCFIGYRSTILPNVTIGNDCIIAAGSMVTKDIPSGEVWGRLSKNSTEHNRVSW